MKTKVLFIINPKSGVRRKVNVPSLIEKVIDKNKIDFDICFTEKEGHATELSAIAVKENCDIVVSVGGDGTLNETVKSLLGKSVTLGIIPLGSGNGLARHLGISMKVQEALQIINEGKTRTIDVCKLNDKYFYSNAGTGFVAEVVHSFHGEKTRGFLGYSLHTMKKFLGFRSQHYSMIVDSERVEGKFFLVNISNSNQFGYNVKIAPEAELTDGLMDLILVRAHPKILNIPLMIDLFRGKIHQNKNVTQKKIKHLAILSDGERKIQIDGEPLLINGNADFSIIPSSLKVIAPN